MAHSFSRTVFVAGAIAGTLISVSACSSGPKMVSKDDIAKQITTKMTDAQGNKPDSVSCPDGLKGEVGRAAELRDEDQGAGLQRQRHRYQREG